MPLAQYSCVQSICIVNDWIVCNISGVRGIPMATPGGRQRRLEGFWEAGAQAEAGGRAKANGGAVRRVAAQSSRAEADRRPEPRSPDVNRMVA